MEEVPAGRRDAGAGEGGRPLHALPRPSAVVGELLAGVAAAEPSGGGDGPRRRGGGGGGGGSGGLYHSRTMAATRGFNMVRMSSLKYPARRRNSREGEEDSGDSLVDMSDWSVYRMYVFSDLAFSHRNAFRDFVLLFYCLSSVLIQTLVPLALFVNNYSTHTLDGANMEDLEVAGPDGGEAEYRYKSFVCQLRGAAQLTNYQISSKILVFLVCLMYFLKMTPLAVRHIIRFIGYNTIKSHQGGGGGVSGVGSAKCGEGGGKGGGGATGGEGGAPRDGEEHVVLPPPAAAPRAQRALSRGVNDFVTFITGDSERVRALSDYAALEAIAWEMGGIRLVMYYVDLYAQTIYVAMAYLFNLFIIYNTEDTFDVIFNALAIEFIVIFDEEAVGPLLNLLEYLFKRSPEQIAEKVTDKIVETERSFDKGSYDTMDDYLGGRFKWRVTKSFVAWFRLIFVKFAIISALVLFEFAMVVLLLALPICY